MDLLMSYKLQNNLQPCHSKVIKAENNVEYTTIYNDVKKTKKESTMQILIFLQYIIPQCRTT